eukprot:2310084-Pleurochrysis_carterae.AAC.1
MLLLRTRAILRRTAGCRYRRRSILRQRKQLEGALRQVFLRLSHALRPLVASDFGRVIEFLGGGQALRPLPTMRRHADAGLLARRHRQKVLRRPRRQYQ